MSDDEDRTCRYGTPLPELPADVIPTKRPITVADQIAVDANGKRRFHGAFTGGFSAGFWNTVGSLEGWKPQAFKSSRSEKAQQLEPQKPTDFMDDEDIGEFGIAPQRIQTTEDFTAKAPDIETRKRPALREDGPVLGTPVLQLFLKPSKDKASVSLLKKMGWREHQGIGSRLTKSEKKKAAERYSKEHIGVKVYNCDMGPFQKPVKESDNEEQDKDSESDDSDEEITFAPDDYEPFLLAFKTNRFGLGYEGLDRTSGSQKSEHVNLFAPFEVLDRKNKKLSITGQAFGVGAFEEDDADIYAKDDMTTYDFSLGEKRKSGVKKAVIVQNANIISGFGVSKSQQKRMNKKIYTVDVPSSFAPRNWAMRKTRFGPSIIPSNSSPVIEGHKRHILTAEERGEMLNEKSVQKQPPPVVESTVVAADIVIKTEPDIVQSQQTEQRALNFIKLPESLNFDRFVSEKDLVVVKEEKVKVEPKKIEVKRTITPWQPCSLLYEKMNIAEPSGSSKRQSKKSGTNFSLFQCLNETKQNRKKTYRERPDFVDVFTKAQHADEELINTRAKVISVSPIPSTSTSSTEPASIPQPKVQTITSATLVKKKITNVEPPVIKPKTDLEIKSLSLEKKHPSEKKDLFKSIFDSDDDEEELSETKANEIKTIPETLLSVHPRNDYLPKAATILNVLRNTSPPRGIFANIFSSRITTKNSDVQEMEILSKNSLEEKSDMDVTESLLYGPSLPIIKSVSVPSTGLIPNLNEPESIVVDEWVEKNEVVENSHKKKDKKKHKKIKKHKKDKGKKKKSKSKEKSR